MAKRSRERLSPDDVERIWWLAVGFIGPVAQLITAISHLIH